MLQQPTMDRSAQTSIMYKNIRKREDHPAILKLGDRVLVKGKHTGLSKYIFPLAYKTLQ